MKIFVTGGTGFIGRRIVPLLKKRKHRVHLMKARLGELDAIEKEITRFKPDVVLHMAWVGIPDYGAVTNAKNLLHGVQFFSILAKLNIKKTVAVGSCSEYDGPESGHWPYTVAKVALRDIGTALFKEMGGTFIWAVPFYVYGAGKPSRSLVPRLLADARRGAVSAVPNNVFFDYVYVQDVADALVLLAEKKNASGVYEIGSGALVSPRAIANVVASLNNLPRIVERKRCKEGLRAHTKKLCALGWKPHYSLRRGLLETAQELYGT